MFIIWFAHGRGLHVLNCVDCDQELRNFSYFCQLGFEPFGIFLCADLHWGMLFVIWRWLQGGGDGSLLAKKATEKIRQ